MTHFAKIVGTGSYLPQRIVTNYDLSQFVDTSHEWILERTGIEQRYLVGEDETASSMAELASQQAFSAAQLAPTDIDLILVATTTPDKVMPSTACLLQAKLNIPGVPAFDISAACSGFIYALNIAEQYLKTGAAQHVLVVGSEVMSSIVDWQDRRTCVLFGDGAGAVILSRASSPGLLSTHIHANGQFHDLLYVPSSLKQNQHEAEPTYVQMAGNEVFRFAVSTLEEMMNETLKHNKLEPGAIDWLVPHQANLRIIKAAAKKLNLSMDQVVVTLNKQGNTSAASIPLALDQAIRDGRIRTGQKVLMEAIGGGFTWGSALAVM